MITRFWREPIVVFVLLGVVLFLVAEYRSVQDSRRIEVDREALVRFIQLQTRSYDAAAAENRFDRLADAAVSDLIRQYVREEALYRRAIEYGLDRNDYVIRRRLVQKVEFEAEGAAMDDRTPLSEDRIRQYFEMHKKDYMVPQRITFTHVFLRGEKRAEAENLLSRLNQSEVSFSEASGYGERFPYQLNYVEREFDEISGHFGADVASRLFDLQADGKRWRGPMQSNHGLHLVLLTKNEPSRIPAMDEIRDRVIRDLEMDIDRQRQTAYIDEIVTEFEVDISSDLTR